MLWMASQISSAGNVTTAMPAPQIPVIQLQAAAMLLWTATTMMPAHPTPAIQLQAAAMLL